MYVILGPGKSTRPLRVQMKYVSNTQPKLATLLFFFARTCKKETDDDIVKKKKKKTYRMSNA